MKTAVKLMLWGSVIPAVLIVLLVFFEINETHREDEVKEVFEVLGEGVEAEFVCDEGSCYVYLRNDQLEVFFRVAKVKFSIMYLDISIDLLFNNANPVDQCKSYSEKIEELSVCFIEL